jgi:hypothetical protein
VKNYPTKNFPPQRKNFGSSPAKNFPSEESSGQEISVALRRRILLAKNLPGEEFSVLTKKILVAKNSPAKNHPSGELSCEQLSGEEFS